MQKLMRSPLIWVALAVVLCPSHLSAQSVALTLSKSFSPSTIGATGTTTMTVTVTNPNSFTVSGISFSDTYPAGLVPNSVGAYTCGTLGSSALFNASGWAFSNVTLGPGASCQVPMLMHPTILGPITNTTSSVTGTGVPTGGPASATLNVVTDIPALSRWALLGLAVVLAAIAALNFRS